MVVEGILGVVILLVVIILFFRVRGLKFLVAYIYLRCIAKRPDRRWLILSRNSDYTSKKKKSTNKKHFSDFATIPEISRSALSDSDSWKLKFEDAVVELLRTKVKSLSETDDLDPMPIHQRISEANFNFQDWNRENSLREMPKISPRRVTYPPDNKESSSERSPILEKRESIMKKLTEHGEITISMMKEISPIFFYRSSKEEGYVWLELSRHFTSEHNNFCDLMNFYAFDEDGNFIAIWAMRKAQNCPKDLTLPHKTATSSHFRKKIGDSQMNVLEQGSGQEIKCLCEMFVFIHLEGVGSYQGSNINAPLMCPCGTTIHRPKAIVEEPFFDVCGMRLECVEAMSKWKIIFKGSLIKKGDEGDKNCEANVQFSFWWNAVCHPFHFQQEQSNTCLAEAAAQETWSKQFFKDFGNWRSRKEIYYSQWGGMRGILKIDEFSKVMNLKGPRVHFYGTSDYLHNRPSTLWMIHTEKGHMVHLESTMIQNVLKDLKIGYLSLPNGSVQRVTTLNLKNETTSKMKIYPTKWNFKFYAGSRSHQVTCDVLQTIKTKFYNEMAIQFATIEMSGFKGYAVSRLCDWEPSEEIYLAGRKCAQVSFRENQSMHRDVDTWTLQLGNPMCVNITLAGIKGSHLAYLYQIPNKEFKIADGFCLTTNALEYHLFHHPSVRKAINQLKIKTTMNSPDLIKDCEEVEALLRGTPLLNELKWEVEDILAKQFGTEYVNKAFAIRISTNIGDGYGILGKSVKPTLNVKGLDKIFKAVTHCWSIPYSYESVIHRKQNGLKIDIFVSLIIQEMTYPKITGTINTGDNDLRCPEGIRISSFKDGRNQPEVILSRDCHGNMFILEIYLKDKADLSPLKVKRRESRIAGLNKLYLSENVLIELGIIAKEIEKSFGTPQIIEFAIDAEEIKHILKVVPITIAMLSDDWLIMHEFDSSLATNHEIIVKDIMNGPVTPLTISMIIPAFNEAFVKIIKSITICGKSNVYEKLLVVLQNRILMNSHQAMMLGAVADFPGCKKIMELCIVGKNLMIDYNDYHPIFSYWKKLVNAIYMLKMAISAPKKLERVQRLCDSIDFTSCKELTSKHLYEKITRNIPVYYGSFYYHSACFTSPHIWLYILKTYLGHSRQEWTADNAHMATMMLSTYTQDELSARFEELLTELNKNNETKKFIKSSPEAFYDWLISPSSGMCGELFQKLLTNYGHRCINDFEFFEKSWNTEPLNFTKIVQSMLEKSNKGALSNKPREEFEMEGIGIFKRVVINYFVKKIFNCLNLRERSKSSLIYVHSKFKEGYWLLADKMIQEGRIPSHELMFFLTHLEIGTLLLTRSPRLINLAKSRMRAIERMAQVSIPNIIIGFDYATIDEYDSIKKQTIIGTPVTRNSVTGRVRVIYTPSDLAFIEKGDVIVTSLFESTWSFCLSYIAGIIIEQGGLLSYGAIYARKYGLPCIVDADGATSYLVSGDNISLNGKTGVIQKLT